MEAHHRRCQRCGEYFTPPQPNHWYCDSCYSEIAPMGSTTIKQRAGAAAHRHGGISRLWAGRPLTLRSSDAAQEILVGFKDFFSDLYRRPMRMSEFLREAGLSQSELESLRDAPHLDKLVMRFCPKLREWLIETLGMNATCVIIDFYGLYGEGRRQLAEIAPDLGLTESHIEALRRWALKRLRKPEKQAALRDIAVAMARELLSAKER